MCVIEKMYKMTEYQSASYRRQFKKFFLEDLFFYWNLSEDNKIFKEIEHYVNMMLSEYSAYIAKREMTIELMQTIINMYRDVLHILVKSKVKVNNDGTIDVEFEQFFIKE